MDREDHGTIRLVPLVLGDAGGQTRTTTVTVTIGDRNDNLSHPGSKTVQVTRLKVKSALIARKMYIKKN